MTETAVYAAGGVIWRLVDGKLKILVIHRTAYVDITLPKGKVDPGETLAETAVREMFEETGIRVSLGVNVGVSRYRMPNKREKIVHYWAAEATDAAIRASAFVPNKEVAAIEWMGIKKARKQLSYPVDVEILENFAKLVDDGVLRTFPIIALRHAKALSREEWKGSESERPLSPRGKREAESLVGPLRAFGPVQIFSSPATRCVKTVTPLSKTIGRRIERTALVSQESWEVGESDERTIVGRLVRGRRAAVVCSHGPVLPGILTEIALATGTLRGSYLGSASSLETGAFSVVHLSATNPGSGIVAIETHEPKR